MSDAGQRLLKGMAELRTLQDRIGERAAELMYGPPIGRPDVPSRPPKDMEGERRQLQEDLAQAVIAIHQVLEAMVEIAGPPTISET